MQLTPKNRHIQVEEVSNTPEDQKGFVLPDDYKPPAKVAQAEDCTQSYLAGDMIAVERHMVKNLDVGGSKYLLILENYVLASFT